MIRRARVLAPAALLSLGACGAMFNSGPANVAFNSSPSGATILIDGTERGTTPSTLSLAKNRNYVVTFRLPGFQDANMELSRKVSGGYVILDILGGVLPVVIDAATGSWYTLSSNNVTMNLTQTTAMSGEAQGQLSPQELAAVKMGTPASRFISADEIAGRQEP